jgi:hypothetical protein
MNSRYHTSSYRPQGFSLWHRLAALWYRHRRWWIALLLIGATNLASHFFFNPGVGEGGGLFVSNAHYEQLYLMDKAGLYIREIPAFGRAVERSAAQLDLPVEWLMAVIYASSRFDPSGGDYRELGAVGLIPFSETSAAQLDVSLPRLAQMTAAQQVPYLTRYFEGIHIKYGPLETLTDLYLAVLYPAALGQDYCYSLFSKPAPAYQRHNHLDTDHDDHVSIQDIDRYLKQYFPQAYHVPRNER